MKTHHTKEKGDLGVAKAFADLVSKGYYVFFSNSEHLPFDLVAYRDGKFLRVSVKYRKSKHGILIVDFKSNWSDKYGNHSIRINKTDIDIMCIYSPDTDTCYYINPMEHEKSISLRIETPKNNQFKNIKWAKDYLMVENAVVV